MDLERIPDSADLRHHVLRELAARPRSTCLAFVVTRTTAMAVNAE
jgi:hypothetical protein